MKSDSLAVDEDKSIEVTQEMAEAGGWALAWWRMYSDEPSDAVVANNVFKIMLAVRDGYVTSDQLKNHLNPNTGHAFFQSFS